MDNACSTYGNDEKCIQNFSLETSKEETTSDTRTLMR